MRITICTLIHLQWSLCSFFTNDPGHKFSVAQRMFSWPCFILTALHWISTDFLQYNPQLLLPVWSIAGYGKGKREEEDGRIWPVQGGQCLSWLSWLKSFSSWWVHLFETFNVCFSRFGLFWFLCKNAVGGHAKWSRQILI